MLIAINGNFGSGKTLFMVLIACSTKKEVWSNFKIDIPNYHPLDITDMINLGYNKDVFLDEAYTWMESRTSSSHLNRFMSYLVFQSRHRSLNIYTSEQLFHTIDIRFRELAHRVIECSRFPNGLRREFWDFRYDVWDSYTNRYQSWLLRYERAKAFFPLYDTFEIIEPFSKDEMELSLLRGNPAKQHKYIMDIAKVIKKDLVNKKKITHSSVRMALLERNYSGAYERLVYDALVDMGIISQ